MRPISPSTHCQHQANSAYDKLAVISANMNKLLEVEQFIFELKQWLRAYIDKVRESISEENFATLVNDNTFTGINTFSDVHLQNGNIYWTDSLGNKLAWLTYDSANQVLTMHVQDSELTLSPNLAMTVPTDTDIPNSIVTYSFLTGLLNELESNLHITVDNEITSDGTNPVSSQAIYDYINEHQFHLTLEDSVIEDSANGVKSSGIYAALQELSTNIEALRNYVDSVVSGVNDLYDTLGVEDGVWTYSESEYDNPSTLLAGHTYKIVSSIHTEYNSGGIVTTNIPVNLSSANIDVVYILEYPTLYIKKAIRPTEDITLSNPGAATMIVREYTELDPSGLSTELTQEAIGWEYTVS